VDETSENIKIKVYSKAKNQSATSDIANKTTRQQCQSMSNTVTADTMQIRLNC